MAIKITKAAKKYIDERNINTIVLTFLEMEAGCMVGVAKDIDVSFDPPEKEEAFLKSNVKGIAVYIDKRLSPSKEVTIRKQGFWRFSSLYADGLRVPI